MTKLVKVKVSGSFRNGNNEIIDFSDLEGVVPSTDEARVNMHVQSRYLPMWISSSKEIKDRPKRIRQVFIDYVSSEFDGKLSCVGKNIKELSFEEIQDLATLKDLRAIPLYKNGSLRDSRIKALYEYSKEILGEELKKDIKLDDLPNIIVADGAKYYERGNINNDVSIALEARKSGMTAELPKQEDFISFEELKVMAKSNGVTFHPNISYEKLKERVLGE